MRKIEIFKSSNMTFNIQVSNPHRAVENSESLQHLLKYLETHIFSDEITLDAGKSVQEDGAMSTGIVSSIVAIVNSVNEPLVELVKCLQEYIKLFKSEITITNSKGEKLAINSKHLESNDFISLVEKFTDAEQLDNDN